MPSCDYGFLWNTPLLVYLQPTKLSDAQALPTSWLGGSTRGLQPGGHVHKEAVHLLSLQPASITSSGAFKPECNDLSQFRENTGVPVREFNLSMPASPIELKNSLPDLDWNPGRRESSARQASRHCGLLNGLAH